MADGLEEPQMPDLNAGMNLGRTMVNAFLSAASVNRQRQQLEERIRESQMRMSLQQQSHDMQMEKMDWQQKFQTAQMQRDRDRLGLQAYLGDQKLDLAERTFELKGARKDAVIQGAGAFQDELTSAAQEYPIESQAFKNKMSVIKHKYSSIIPTEEGQRVLRTFDNENNRAAMQAHKNASELRQNFNDSLNLIGKTKEFTVGDFMQPDKVWGKNPDGSRWIATDANGQRLTPDQVTKVNSAGVKFHTLPADHYNHFRSMADKISDYGGTDLKNKPAVQEQRVRVKGPDGSTGTLPQSQVNDALAAGYTLE